MTRSITSTSRGRRGEDAPNRDLLFDPPNVTLDAIRRLGTITAVDAGEAEPDVMFPLRSPEAIDRDIRQLKRLVRDGMPTIILCDNEGQAERLDELLMEDDRGASPGRAVDRGLDGGFVIPAGSGKREAGSGFDTGRGLRILTDHEIFRRERRIRRARRYISGAAALDTISLKNGDFVVHLEHGVGIYRGIETIFVGQSTIEVAVVEYEGGDRLNVPLYRIDQLERYRSASDVSDDSPPPRLHRLGGRRWGQQREKARIAIQEMTVELLDLYARRKISTRPPHVPDTPWQRQLESAFLFEDTPDQRTATTQVKSDMESTRPMDRLLVGDVGYGKTEIAVRAAFKAVQSERQVAVLVPTTILADQHLRTFQRATCRFSDQDRGDEPIPIGEGADGDSRRPQGEEG
jgi:transcription-repair coupling factor (superfamily II helicase)